MKFKVHDMREAIYPEISTQKVDAVCNLFTSFGYFESDVEDKKIFRSVADALVDNGFFILDFLNEQWVKNTLVPQAITTKGDIEFHISKRIEDQHVIKDINFKDQGEAFHFFEKVKLHTLEEIGSYAEEFGFERVKIYGDYHLGAFDRDTSPRCINVFRKL